MVETGKYNVMYTPNQMEQWEMSLGNKINQFHKKEPMPSTAVCVLYGAFQFFPRTIRYLAFDVNIDFVRVSSYKGTDKSDTFSIQRFRDEHGFEEAIPTGQRIYIFDDIIDTGDTAKRLAEYYQANFDPCEMILCSAFARATTPITELKEYYSQIWPGYIIDDEWLCGYGMNNPEGFMRQAPNVLKIKKEIK